MIQNCTKLWVLIFALVCFATLALAQKEGTITGTVRDKNTQELLTGVTIVAEGANIAAATDDKGNYKLRLPVGSYNIKAIFIGYQPLTKFNINLTSGNASIVNFEISETEVKTGEVEIVGTKSATRVADVVTPLSVQSLSTEEIRSNPGGNFDISRVIQTLPGVGGSSSTGGVRNDIIIRGGAPNENVFYLDGIEIPVINHFATQGSAGGPTGILNVSFIEDVKLSSSSFDARFDNALASVFEFKQRQGNPDRLSGNVRLSSSELATTLEGPMGPKSTFIASARRSYLQFLFTALDLPIRPNYWDFQLKTTHQLTPKTTLTFVGVGAIDEFSFAVPKESTPDKEYAIRSNPTINQWNYTGGLALRHSIKGGYWNLALSRNHFDNALDQFENAEFGNESKRTLRFRSDEIENKLRFDVNKLRAGWKISYGLMSQIVETRNDLFRRIRQEFTDGQGNIIQPEISIKYNSNLGFLRYGGFAQASKTLGRISVSIGLRTDGNTLTNDGHSLLSRLSPRMALSYALTPQINLNASVGNYYKIPIYTVLSFRDAKGELVNKDNKYIRSTHYVGGLEYLPKEGLRFTLEGFYKDYGNYPVSLRDGISLANQGGEFGVIGNEKTISNGRGKAFGFEFFAQQKFNSKIFAVFSYTFVRSEFSGSNNKLIPSAWDNRHLISALLGRKFKKGWEIGLKYRFAGGSPYTPFDMQQSQRNFLTTGAGVLDFNRLNTLRLTNFNQFDFRVDKKINFNKLTLDLFFDVQNAFVIPNQAFPQYFFQRTSDNTAFATTDGQLIKLDGSNGIPTILSNNDPVVQPTLGFILEF